MRDDTRETEPVPGGMGKKGALNVGSGTTRVAVLVDRLSNELEVLYPIWRLREAGIDVRVLTKDGLPPGPGENGMAMDKYIPEADGIIAEADPGDYDGVVCPGGFSPDYLRALPEVKRL